MSWTTTVNVQCQMNSYTSLLTVNVQLNVSLDLESFQTILR